MRTSPRAGSGVDPDRHQMAMAMLAGMVPSAYQTLFSTTFQNTSSSSMSSIVLEADEFGRARRGAGEKKACDQRRDGGVVGEGDQQYRRRRQQQPAVDVARIESEPRQCFETATWTQDARAESISPRLRGCRELAVALEQPVGLFLCATQGLRGRFVPGQRTGWRRPEACAHVPSDRWTARRWRTRAGPGPPRRGELLDIALSCRCLIGVGRVPM